MSGRIGFWSGLKRPAPRAARFSFGRACDGDSDVMMMT